MIHLNASQEALLRAHRDIDLRVRTERLPFVSGWRTTHNLKYEHFSPVENPDFSRDDGQEYRFISDDELLKGKIRQFHIESDGEFPAAGDVFVGAGSSPLLSSVMMLLSISGNTVVLYTKPMYHAWYYMAKVLGVRLSAVGDIMSDASELSILNNLPDSRSVLVVTDPSWVSGRFASEGFWREISCWQSRTASLVVVDGTFEYTKWGGIGREFASCLDGENTIRLVCPTKSLCVHGIRFAYLILPRRFTEDLGYAYAKLVASTSLFDVATAHCAIDQLRSATSNRQLTRLISARYTELVRTGAVATPLNEPTCTYYAFAKLGIAHSSCITMDGTYFELGDADSYVRLNILSPDLDPWLSSDTSERSVLPGTTRL